MRIAAITLLLASCLLSITGCSTSSAVMASSGGTYTVTKTGTTGFTPLGSLRSGAYEKANKFAASKGMVAEVISVNETPQGFGRWPQVDLRFRLVSATARESGQGTPAVSIKTQAGHDAMGRPSDVETAVTFSKETDFYSELKKLGELKEKGLLTEDEFQREKQRLLDAKNR